MRNTVQARLQGVSFSREYASPFYLLASMFFDSAKGTKGTEKSASPFHNLFTLHPFRRPFCVTRIESRDIEVIFTPRRAGFLDGVLVGCDVEAAEAPIGFRIFTDVQNLDVSYRVRDPLKEPLEEEEEDAGSVASPQSKGRRVTLRGVDSHRGGSKVSQSSPFAPKGRRFTPTGVDSHRGGVDSHRGGVDSHRRASIHTDGRRFTPTGGRRFTPRGLQGKPAQSVLSLAAQPGLKPRGVATNASQPSRTLAERGDSFYADAFEP
eukprot:1189076-Prorocentrum_minimum.AAC.2